MFCNFSDFKYWIDILCLCLKTGMGPENIKEGGGGGSEKKVS